MGCPCSYQAQPILHLRGVCSNTDLELRYSPFQLPANPTDVFFVGQISAKITFNSSLHQWIIADKYKAVEARTDASHNSFALGRNNWTITGDKIECSKNQSSYTIELKLTGCKENEFTCDDGQCVKMERRCNQLPNCRDKSDERGCKIMLLEPGYNKRVPPIRPASQDDDTVIPVTVNVSLTLLKVVSIEEEEHSIHLQFQITLAWKDNRVIYHNLKTNMYLNALSSEDISTLWLPLVIYTNTDQQETTRLGVEWEWSTNVWVKREGIFTRSRLSVLDETEIFQGAANSMVMVQSYTHEFQCVYQLEGVRFRS